MSGAVLNSQILTWLVTSGDENFERVSMLKEDISSTACELTMLILCMSVTFSVTCLTATFLLRNYANRFGQYILVYLIR